MKVRMITIFVFFLLVPQGKAQESQADSLLNLLEQNLPNGWTSSVSNSLLRIEYEDSIWVAHGNWINAHEDHFALKDDSLWIKEYGRKTKLIFEYELIDKLTIEEVNKLRNSEEKYQGRWAKTIYNSEKYTIFEKTSPSVSFEYNAIWPKDVGIWKVKQLFREYMAVPY